MNDQKQNAMVALVFFCIAVIAYQFIFNRPSGEMTYGGIGGRMMISLLVGAAAGGIAWVVAAVVNR